MSCLVSNESGGFSFSLFCSFLYNMDILGLKLASHQVIRFSVCLIFFLLAGLIKIYKAPYFQTNNENVHLHLKIRLRASVVKDFVNSQRVLGVILRRKRMDIKWRKTVIRIEDRFPVEIWESLKMILGIEYHDYSLVMTKRMIRSSR